MEMMTNRLLRVVPGAAIALALISVLLNVLSHVHTGAAPPPPIWMHE
jgi:hypothetical protein